MALVQWRSGFVSSLAVNRIIEDFALTTGNQPFAVFVSIRRPQGHSMNVRDPTRNLWKLSFNMEFGKFLIRPWVLNALHECLIQLHTVSPPL